MNNNQGILVKNIILASGGRNILKYEKDKKKRGRVVGAYVGKGILYTVLVFLSFFAALGYGGWGMYDVIPVVMAEGICVVELFFTMLISNGYLFAFKEYDMLMSLPFSVKTVVSSKFIYMFLRNLPITYSISLPMLGVYLIFAPFSIMTTVLWIVLSALISLIPMVLASALGALVAFIGSGFKYKQLVQTILTFAFILLCFSSRFIIEGIFRSNAMGKTIEDSAQMFQSAATFYPPVNWFDEAVTEHKISGLLLFVGVSVLVYELFFIIVSKRYRQINSRLMTGASHKKYKMETLKTKSVIQSIVFKEFKRLTGSTIYITNMCIGYLLIVILAITLLFVDMDSILKIVTNGAPVSKEYLIPAVPLIVYFMTGICATTTCSLSLEGKSFWIIRSLPINMTDVIKGKMLFNMYLAVPFTILGNVVLGIAVKASVLEIVFFLIFGLILCAFSTVLGMLTGITHPKMDWENEVEVIKQGSAIALYMIPNMIATLFLVVLVIFIGRIVGTMPVIIVLSIISTVMTVVIYAIVMHKAKTFR